MDKDIVAKWLKDHSKDRDWLAKQLGATKRTIDSWFSTRGFPPWAITNLERLMRESATTPDGRILATFTTDEFELIEAARHEVGDPPRPQFYHDAIMEYTEAILNKESGKKVTYGQFTQDIHPEARVAEE